MRIIDQNGCDYPYESIAISYGDGIIYARPISNMDKRYLIAQYSSQEKAEKAMQMLHSYYGDYMIEKVYKQEIRSMWPVFQFPQEDEI